MFQLEAQKNSVYFEPNDSQLIILNVEFASLPNTQAGQLENSWRLAAG